MVKKIICLLKKHKFAEIGPENVELLDQEGYVRLKTYCTRCGKTETKDVHNPIIYAMVVSYLQERTLLRRSELKVINGGKT